MALIEDTLFGHEDKVQTAIKRIQAFAPSNGDPLWVAFSGGKDSQCVYHLTQMAGVPFEAHYTVTSVDPPELMRFIRKHYPDVIWDRPRWNDGKPEHYYPDGSPKQITMFSLIADHTIPPTRQARYCCASLKEPAGGGHVIVTGVRWAESARRRALHGVADIQSGSKKLHAQAAESPTYKSNKNGGIIFMDDNETNRRMVEQCYAKRKTTINPIVDWTDEDVWEYLNDVANVPHCELYDEGFTRLGCIGCPLQGREGMLRDFERWPGYKKLYIAAFDKMIKNHPGEIKVASGEMVENTIGGGDSDIHRLAPLVLLTGLRMTLTSGDPIQETSSQIIQVERERDRRGWCYKWATNDAPFHTHGATIGALVARKSCAGGYGCSETATEANKTQYAGNDVSDLLAVALPERSGRQGAKTYNPDPTVADYADADEVMEFWLGAFHC